MISLLKISALLLPLIARSFALNAPILNNPNPNSCYKSVGFWGQNSAGIGNPQNLWEKDLVAYCDGTWDVINIAFVHLMSTGSPSRPGLNLAFHCETTFPGYPFLLNCPSIGNDIATCQRRGVKIFISIGGATFGDSFTSETAASNFATQIWNMYLGGSDSAFQRPFGSVKLDGVDLDIEAGSYVGWGTFAVKLREFYENDKAKTYYISGSPQCVFEDFFLGPQPSGSSYNKYALTFGRFDWINIQFYNNFCNAGGANFNFATWNNWAKTSKVQLIMGVPGSSRSAGTGYNSASKVKEILQQLHSTYGPAKGGWFSGLMVWDVSTSSINTVNGVTFAKDVTSYLHSLDSSACSNNNPSTTQTTKTSSSTSQTSKTTSSTSTSTSSSATKTSTSASPSPTQTKCTTGFSECISSTSYRVCSNGAFFTLSCPSGTVCYDSSGAALCDFPKGPAPTTRSSIRTTTPVRTTSSVRTTASPTRTSTTSPSPSPTGCVSGATRCAGTTGFEQCSNNVWYRQSCPGGTRCFFRNGIAVCDF